MLLSDEKDRERQIAFNEQQVKEVWGDDFEAVAVDFETDDGSVYHYDELVDALEKMLHGNVAPPSDPAPPLPGSDP